MGLTTKIYGIFPVNIKSYEALRHTLTPSVSISFIPNITKPVMGYDLNKLFTNAGSFEFDDEEKLLDPFYSSVVSPTSEREKLVYKFSIQNLFQTKYISNVDQVNNPQYSKATILDWNIKTQYDALADSVNWTPITSRMKSQIPLIGSNLDIDLTHDIYKINNNGNRINDFYDEFYGIPIPQLTKINIRTSFSLSGSRVLELDNSTRLLEIDTLPDGNIMSKPSLRRCFFSFLVVSIFLFIVSSKPSS